MSFSFEQPTHHKQNMNIIRFQHKKQLYNVGVKNLVIVSLTTQTQKVLIHVDIVTATRSQAQDFWELNNILCCHLAELQLGLDCLIKDHIRIHLFVFVATVFIIFCVFLGYCSRDIKRTVHQFINFFRVNTLGCRLAWIDKVDTNLVLSRFVSCNSLGKR